MRFERPKCGGAGGPSASRCPACRTVCDSERCDYYYGVSGSYDELGNQRDLYAKRPGHAPVAQVGLKGVFLKAEPSSDELIVQLKWMAANVEQFLFEKRDQIKTVVWNFPKIRDQVDEDLLKGPDELSNLSPTTGKKSEIKLSKCS